MGIPEAQLETWSGLGSVTQSAQTYQTIRGVLNDSSSPYHPKEFKIFLQGSYGNDTNVYGDSDVDVVIQLDDTFYYDLTQLEPDAKTSFQTSYGDAQYGLKEFKPEVLAWLTKKFGSDVKPGKKAIFIKENGNRRDADVLVCGTIRRYQKGSTGTDLNYDEGICFFLPDGTRITNFPKQHADNCTTKHQATNEWFKPMVRVFKNMRNRMVQDKYLEDGVAPSYFLEGMLWNVPNEKFGTNFESSWVGAFNWLIQADETKLACANDLYWLIRENSHNCWSSANFNAFLNAASKYWDDWGG
jgi:hypothetical protein